MIRRNILLIYILIIMPSMSFGADISSKMETLAKKIVASYETHRKTEKIITLSVIPFQTDNEKLLKWHIGFGSSELLTDYLIRLGLGKFIIVERNQLAKILAEQQLSLTGVIEQASAIQAGRLLGTEFLVLGNVSQEGNDYTINARLVNSETGSIITDERVTLKTKEFHKTAADYIKLPQNWALFYSFKRITFEQIYEPVQYTGKNDVGDSFTATAINTTDTKDCLTYSLGIRRIFFDRILIEAQIPLTQHIGAMTYTMEYKDGYQEDMVAPHPYGAVYWIHNPEKHKMLRYYIGGGVFRMCGGTSDDVAQFFSVRAGVEKETKKRIRVGFFCEYILNSDEIFYLDIMERYNDSPLYVKLPVFKIKPLSFEILVSFYF